MATSVEEKKLSKSNNLPLTSSSLKKYLSSLLNEPVDVLKVYRLGEAPENSGDLKGFGYGFPYVVEYKVRSEIRKAVLETMRPGDFGHNHFSDRAQILIWQNSAFNSLPKHVHSVDVGSYTFSLTQTAISVNRDAVGWTLDKSCSCAVCMGRQS